MTDALLGQLSCGVTVYDLAQPLETGMPCSPNHPGFRMALMRRHGDVVRPDGSSSASEIIVTGGHVGTHIDGLAHISFRGHLYGGRSAPDTQAGGQMSALGVDEIPPMVCRGVLLDVAALHGAEPLPAAYGISADDLHAAEQRAGLTLNDGDVALIRTGWARHWLDPQTYLGHASGVPGVTHDGARWLADTGVRATGADTTAYERTSPGEGHRLLPVHRLLLVERGIPIIEHLNLESLAAAGATEFMFMLAPLRIVGGTASPVRPLAVVAAK